MNPNIKTGVGVPPAFEGQAARRFFGHTTKSVDAAARTVKGVASSIAVDRDGEILLPSGFAKSLAPYLAGPAAFLAAHMHRSSDGTPTQIGCVKDASLSELDLTCTFYFAQTPTAQEWWTLASDPNGKGIAFSVGFIPKDWLYGTVAEMAAEFPEIKAAVAKAGLKDADRLFVYTEIELLEISACPVGSNPDAIQILAAGNAYSQGIAKTVHDAVEKSFAAIEKKLSDEIKIVLMDQFDELKALMPYAREADGPDEDSPSSDEPAGEGHDSPSEGKTTDKLIEEVIAALKKSAAG